MGSGPVLCVSASTPWAHAAAAPHRACMHATAAQTITVHVCASAFREEPACLARPLMPRRRFDPPPAPQLVQDPLLDRDPAAAGRKGRAVLHVYLLQ